eukprot:TRINITY_DN1756_c0_g1_i4.p1 TRINITY_DN1756_c0_g1~~TRINITY_DN1756_c0_g1_i4.p1  ORF type:complete len:242 (+),score=46.20 TRINITY_DN1756_c0_g1_i4:222-947(+)
MPGYWEVGGVLTRFTLLQPHSRKYSTESMEYNTVVEQYKKNGFYHNKDHELIPVQERSPRLFLILYDMTDKKALDSIQQGWAKDIFENVEDGDSLGVVLVGTKQDEWAEVQGDKPTTFEQGYQVAKEIGAKGFCCISAKTRLGVDNGDQEFSADGMSLKDKISQILMNPDQELPTIQCQRIDQPPPAPAPAPATSTAAPAASASAASGQSSPGPTDVQQDTRPAPDNSKDKKGDGGCCVIA